MTTLIYRGVTHDGQRSTAARKPRNLIYRGVAHDGLRAATRPRTSMAEMCYRGIRHLLGAKDALPSAPRSAPRPRLADLVL
jgi:hypothetical protein